MNKLTLVILLLLPFYLIAQNKEVEIIVKKDDFTGETSKTTKPWGDIGISTSKEPFTMYTSYSNNIFQLHIFLGSDLGCFVNQKSTLQVKLENDKIVSFIYYSTTDCGKYAQGTFLPLEFKDLSNPNYNEIVDENINLLKSSPWKAIRLTGSEYFTNILPNKTRNYKNPELFFVEHLKKLEI